MSATTGKTKQATTELQSKETLQKALLVCGIISSLLYVCTDIIASLLWQGYSFVNQAVSELSAIGAPTRDFIVPLVLLYDAIVIAFGLGIWEYSRKRAQRFVGALLVGHAAVGLVWYFFPIRMRGAEITITDAIHSALAGVTVLLILLIIGLES